MARTLREVLDAKGCVILDGGLGTELSNRGANLKDPLWSAKVLLDSPQLMVDIHRDFIRSGADVIITGSYQATFEGLTAKGLDDAAAESVLRQSVALAKKAIEEERPERPILVAASAGAYGAYLADGSEYSGEYGVSRTELARFHRRRAEVLLDEGADLIAFETIPSLLEALAIRDVMEDLPGSHSWVCFSAKRYPVVCHGEPFVECVRALEPCAQIDAIGLNCSPPALMPSMLREAARVTEKPLVAYPNAGGSWEGNKGVWIRGESQLKSFDEHVLEAWDAGARIVGGCCRTSPEDIQAIAAGVSDRLSR